LRRADPGGHSRFIADRLERDLDSSTDCVEAVPADEPIARDLRLNVGSAVLRVVSTMFAEGWPIEAGEYFYAARTPLTYTYSV
jgi:DNA-binding GntR family transcriptional regulator